MPIWFTFLASVFAAAGLFVAGYFAIEAFVGRRQAFGRPRLILNGGDGKGQIGVGVSWNTSFYDVEFYRIDVRCFSPDHDEKESRFTLSYLPPNKEPFFQSFGFSESFKRVLEGTSDKRAVFNISVRTTGELSIEKELNIKKMRKLYNETGKDPAKVKKLEAREHDAAMQISLDYEELEMHKGRIDKLLAAAKAKADKAKAAAEAKAKAAAEAAKAEKAPEDQPVPAKG